MRCVHVVVSVTLLMLVVVGSAHAASVYYDEQMLAIFHGTYSQLAYNVTVEPNADTISAPW